MSQFGMQMPGGRGRSETECRGRGSDHGAALAWAWALREWGGCGGGWLRVRGGNPLRTVTHRQ